MKICFDIRALVGQMWFGSGTGSAIAPAGVGVYILRLLDGLTTLDENKEYILFYNSFKKPNLRLIENILQRPNVTLKSFRYPNKVLDRTARFLNWPKIDRLLGGVDVFFSPHINISPLTAQAKHIQVIHDLSFAVYPEFYSWRKRYWNWAQNVKATCARADQIIAVSESTKSDILSLYDVNETKVKVVYPGITEITQVKDFKNYKGKQTDWSLRLTNSLPAEYILYLGTLEPRKNVESILEAYECLNRNIANAPALVIAGGKGWAYKNIFRLAKTSRWRDKIIFTGYIAEPDKAVLYSRARLFVWPSYYEGFGFPPLEAMSYGVPVIASSVSSLPEILGPAAILVNPHDVNNLAEAMQLVLSNETLRQKLVQLGRAVSQNFIWRDSIAKVAALINSL